MDQRSKLQQGILCALALAGLAGCSSLNNMMEPDRIDYKSANKATAKTPNLEVPPDLTQRICAIKPPLPENAARRRLI